MTQTLALFVKITGVCSPFSIEYKFEQLGVTTLLDAIYTNWITPFMES